MVVVPAAATARRRGAHPPHRGGVLVFVWQARARQPILSEMSYGPFVPIYASLAGLYSGGAIPACQRWAVDQVPVGARVLFAGPGPGKDVVAAARRGLRVTAIDEDADMLQVTARRLQPIAAEHPVELICADLMQQAPTAAYDVVIAQFFLNVFAAKQLPEVLAALAGHLAPAGCLIVGDFADLPPGDHPWQRRYHDLPMRILARFGANAVHPVHDLPGHLRVAGFAVRDRRRFRLFGVGPPWIEGLVAEPMLP